MKKVVNQIEKKLDLFFKPQASSNEHPQTEFEVSKELHLLDEIGRNLPDDTVDRVILLFTKLMIFFERGLLLERVDGKNFVPQIVFNEGQLMAIDGYREGLCCELPSIHQYSIFKLKNLALLNSLKLQEMANDPKLTSLLFQPLPEFSFILFSSMPDLWLKDHAKETLEKLIKNLEP